MRLVDFQIEALCRAGMVKPFDPAMLNPCGLDVRLGDVLLIESVQGPGLVEYPLHVHSKEDPYLFVPGQFALAPTIEMFWLPDDVEAQFVLKSSRAREGLEHLMAGYCEPDWSGSVLTMELKNQRQLHPVPIWPGMRVGQLKFDKLEVKPRRSYKEVGRYNGHTTAMQSLGEP